MLNRLPKKGVVLRAAFITNSLFFKGQVWQDLYDYTGEKGCDMENINKLQ